MKFQVSTLLAALSKVSPIVNKNSPTPILGDVLIKVKDGLAILTGTSLRTEVSVACPVDDAVDGEALCVSVARLLLVLRTIDGEAVTIKPLAPAKRDAGSHVYQLSCGKAKFRLVGRPPEDFALMEKNANTIAVSVNEGEFRKAVTEVAYAMASHDVRAYLNGILIEATATEVRVVASDGHRIAKAVVPVNAPLSTNDDLPAGTFSRIVDQEVVRGLLLRALDPKGGEMRIRVSPTLIEFESASLRFTSLLLEGRYPAYERVIPAQTEININVNRVDLLTMVTRADILMGGGKDAVRVQLQFKDGALEVSAQNETGENYVEEMDIDYVGPDARTTYNVNYLIDALSNRSEETLSFGIDSAHPGQVSRALLTSDASAGFAAVVMAMRDAPAPAPVQAPAPDAAVSAAQDEEEAVAA